MKRILFSKFFKGKQRDVAKEIDELEQKLEDKKQELENLEIISICDGRGNIYKFNKPKDFEVDLLKVVDNFSKKGISGYISIIAHVRGAYDSDIAICYGPSGNVFDNRFDNEDGKSKYELKEVVCNE